MRPNRAMCGSWPCTTGSLGASAFDRLVGTPAAPIWGAGGVDPSVGGGAASAAQPRAGPGKLGPPSGSTFRWLRTLESCRQHAPASSASPRRSTLPACRPTGGLLLTILAAAAEFERLLACLLATESAEPAPAATSIDSGPSAPAGGVGGVGARKSGRPECRVPSRGVVPTVRVHRNEGKTSNVPRPGAVVCVPLEPERVRGGRSCWRSRGGRTGARRGGERGAHVTGRLLPASGGGARPGARAGRRPGRLRRPAAAVGRPGCPKLAPAGALFRWLRSERQLRPHAAHWVGVRRGRLPYHSGLTKIRHRLGLEVVRRFFGHVVES
jgi:hypothetical protein